MKSLIVFVRKNTQYVEASEVLPLGALKDALRQNTGEVLSCEKIKEIHERRVKQKNENGVSDKEHIGEIHRLKRAIAMNVCPRCGGSLIERNGKRGIFYACSDYPKCRFTKK